MKVDDLHPNSEGLVLNDAGEVVLHQYDRIPELRSEDSAAFSGCPNSVMLINQMANSPEKIYCAETCNICGSTRFRRVHHFREWNLGREPVRDVSILRCLSCGVRRRSPGIEDDYEEEYHAPYVEQGSAIHPHQLGHFSDLMTARLASVLRTEVQFLDVGCSTGRILRLAIDDDFYHRPGLFPLGGAALPGPWFRRRPGHHSRAVARGSHLRCHSLLPYDRACARSRGVFA